jgi:glycosyltransferase involved in cell wall biosynthesis
MNTHPAISVIITTYNRAHLLPTALDALLAQQLDVPYEVIVVDNNSTDGTKEVIHSRLQRASHLRYAFEGRQGIPFARNTGILTATAPILAFTDDDVEVGPEWVATIKRVFDENPDVDMIGGRVRPRWPAGNLPSWITARQLGPFALGERGDAQVRVSAANAAPCLVGANFAFRRSVVERVGLFDTDYIRSQDRELQLRLWRAGGVGLYVPEMAIAVEVPPERLTKTYFRYWYTTYGRYHSRMRLLDSIDHEGRLREPRGTHVFGVPAFLYRGLLRNLANWLVSALRVDTTAAFYWENRFRYQLAYILERFRSGRTTA